MLIENVEEIISLINWEKIGGLLPVIIQDEQDFTILMLGYMTEEALNKTLNDGIVTFYSRTKRRLWTKGETSGNYLQVQQYFFDCDHDAMLILVCARGPVCHLGTQSCFNQKLPFLQELSKVIDQKFKNGSQNSYVKKLYEEGQRRIAQKVGEEAVEVVIASADNERSAIIEETADLLFHMLVNLRYHNIAWQEIIDTLKKRVK